MKSLNMSLIVILFLCSNYIYSQETKIDDSLILPKPVIGWDSLSTLIKYPDICRRAGMIGFYLVDIEIDSTGIMQNMTFTELNGHRIDDILTKNITTTLKSIKWLPGSRKNKNIDYELTLPVLYFLTYEGHIKPIIKVAPRIEKQSHIYN